MIPDFSILTGHWESFLIGLRNTVLASVLALAASFAVGTLIAVCRISPWRWLNVVGTVYVEVFRNIPLLLVVYGFYLGLPVVGIPLNGFVSGTLGLTVYTSAFIAEAIRAGIMAVPRGQTEAARSSGLDYMAAMRYVVLPQAVKIVIPPITNQFLNLVKNSSVLGVVAGLDLMYYGDIVHLETYNTPDTYFFVALLYLLLTLPLAYASKRLERRLARSG